MVRDWSKTHRMLRTDKMPRMDAPVEMPKLAIPSEPVTPQQLAAAWGAKRGTFVYTPKGTKHRQAKKTLPELTEETRQRLLDEQEAMDRALMVSGRDGKPITKTAVSVDGLKDVKPAEHEPTYAEKLDDLFPGRPQIRTWDDVANWMRANYRSVKPGPILKKGYGWDGKPETWAAAAAKMVAYFPTLLLILAEKESRGYKVKPGTVTEILRDKQPFHLSEEDIHRLRENRRKKAEADTQEKIREARKQEDSVRKNREIQDQIEKAQQQDALWKAWNARRHEIDFTAALAGAREIVEKALPDMPGLKPAQQKMREQVIEGATRTAVCEAVATALGFAGVMFRDFAQCREVYEYAQNPPAAEKPGHHLSEGDILVLQERMDRQLPEIRSRIDVGALWHECGEDAVRFAIEVAHMCGLNGESEMVCDAVWAEHVVGVMWR